MRRPRLASLLGYVILAMPFQLFANDDATVRVANSWYDLQLRLVKETPGFSPPVAARAFGYTGIALYEAVRPGLPGYQSLTGQLNKFDYVPQATPKVEYHWPAVANSALATITRRLYPTATDTNKEALEALYKRNADSYRASAPPNVVSQSEKFGEDVAAAVFEWSRTDGGHEAYLRNFPADYIAPKGQGLWEPTPRTNGDPQPALQPYWGNLRTLLPRVGNCDPPAPPAYSDARDSRFQREVLEVYQVSQKLNPEQIEIARFWADDPGETATPPGHSVAILMQLLEEPGVSPALAAEAYAKVGIAVSDAFVGCWSTKYRYGLVRPVTAIRNTYDKEWLPLLNTPPFPEYTSGHSVQTSAAAAVLSTLFGDGHAFTDRSHTADGRAPRSFASFADMAEEAAISRLYAGIHYRAAIEAGLSQGDCIGKRVNKLVFSRVAK
jgi:hypothetical protein